MTEPVEVKTPENEKIQSWAWYKVVTGVVVQLYYHPAFKDGFPDRYVLKIGGNYVHKIFEHEFTDEVKAKKAFEAVTPEDVEILHQDFLARTTKSGKIWGVEQKLRGGLFS